MPESVINNDQRYIDGLLKNDDKIIAAIYRNFAGKINHWICANSGTSDDAADIFQESIISIYRQAKDKKLMLTCPFEPFFLMVCKRKWWNELKKRSRQGVTISLESVSETGQEPEALASELMMMEEKDLLIQQFFRQLGERCREIISQTLSGEHQEKVAAKLGVSYAYLRKKKSECMGKLTMMIRQSPEFKNMKGPH